jgi:hypothetical protein
MQEVLGSFVLTPSASALKSPLENRKTEATTPKPAQYKRLHFKENILAPAMSVFAPL